MDAIGTQRAEKLLRATKRSDKDDLWGNAGSPLDGIPSKRCATLGLSRGLRMDDGTFPISSDDLYARLGSASAPTVVDVRRNVSDPASGRMVVSAFHCPPEEVKGLSHITLNRPVVVYCQDGHDISQSIARARASRRRRRELLSGGRYRRLDREGVADTPRRDHGGRPLGNTGAAQGRTDRLSLADQTLHRSPIRVSLCSCR